MIHQSQGDSHAGRRDPVASRVPFFYGWIMLPVVMITQILTAPGQTFGVSVFNPFLREALLLSQSTFSGAYMLGTLLAALPQTYVGALMDRHGPRRTLFGVVVLFGLACLWMSQVQGLLMLFVAFWLLRMLGQGAMGLLSANALAMWFNRRLGFAGGLMSVGTALSMGGTPALVLWMIHSYGWRWTYALLGLLVWSIMAPLLIFVFRNRPEDVGQEPDGGMAAGSANYPAQTGASFSLSEAMQTRAYWIGAAASAHWSMIGTGIQFHLVQIFLDRGMTAEDAALAFAVLAGSVAFARFGGGLLADRAPLNVLLVIAPIFLASGILLLQFSSSIWTARLFAGALGMGSGLLMAIHTTLWVRYFGRGHLGKIRGSLATVEVGASSLGPFAMGFFYDWFGGYSEILWIFLGIVLIVMCLGGFATAPTRKN